jgi:DNA-directed RNA polymerase subunit alpha
VFINFDELSSEQDQGKESDLDLDSNWFKSIDELELSVRATNCLKAANIQLVGELVQRTEQQMLKTKNFGRKSLDEIRRVLDGMNLKFGMSIEEFDKKHQEWLKRKEKNEA